MDSFALIKVNYGDTLRRFNARIVDGKFELNIDDLRKKICGLFNFPPTTEIILTYVDEDKDLVTLADDADLCDVVNQALHTVRITVQLKSKRNSQNSSRFGGTSTPLTSPQVEPWDGLDASLSQIFRTVEAPLRETILKLSPVLASMVVPTGSNGASLLQNLDAGICQILGTLQEPLQGIEKLSTDLASNSSTSATVISELAEYISTLTRHVQPSTQDGDTPRSTALVETEGLSMANGSTSNVPANTQSACPCTKRNQTSSKPLPESVLKSSELKCGDRNKISSSKTPATTAVAKNIPSVDAFDMPTNPLDNVSSPQSEEGGSKNGSLKNVHDRLGYFQGPIWSQNPRCPAAPRISSQKYGGPMVFHRNVQCDGCGVHPIAGPRFKSIIKVNYDLCHTCFSKMGNNSHYMRMDYPTYHPNVFGGSYDMAHNAASEESKFKCGASKLNSRFIKDVNINDDTVMAPATPFTKIWRMQNNGTLSWPQKTQIVWIGGDKMSSELSFEVEIPTAGLPLDQEIDVAVDFIAPQLPGRYVSYWRMASPAGQKFGQRLWVLIQVDASLEDSEHESTKSFNLNLLPVNDPEIINVDPEPIEVDNSKKPVEVVDMLPNMENEMKFPINDSLLIGETSTIPSAPLELPKKETEEKLLEELEFMGFEQSDLNKLVLRSNNYDLDKSVEDLCDVSEWDPILEELKEMGFEDAVTNKMLLKKNNGSIKRVVMDLIAGE